MSPEQVRGGRVDRRADVFALGVVLWELVTGRRLFGGGSDLQALERVARCEVPRPSTLTESFPLELEAIVLRALAKHRSERYRTAYHLSRDLRLYLMRSGALVGFEELGSHVRHVLPGRFHAREALLRWACDMTGTRAAIGIPDPIPALATPTLVTLPRDGEERAARTLVDVRPPHEEFEDDGQATRILPCVAPALEPAARRPPPAPARGPSREMADPALDRPRRWRLVAAATTALAVLWIAMAAM
jgi:hypothetical protein